MNFSNNNITNLDCDLVIISRLWTFVVLLTFNTYLRRIGVRVNISSSIRMEWSEDDQLLQKYQYKNAKCRISFDKEIYY